MMILYPLYTLFLIISFLGFLIGIATGYLSKNELKSGRKYIIITRFVLLVIIGLAILLSSINYLRLFLIGTIAGLLIGYLLKRSLTKQIDSFSYLFLGLTLYASYFTQNFTLFSALIMFYGVPTGSLMLRYKRKKISFDKPMLIKYLVIFSLPSLILLIDLGDYWPFMMGLALTGLFSDLVI